MSNYVKKIVTVVTCAVLTALFIVIMHFCAPKISAVPETTGNITYTEFEQTDETYSETKQSAVIGEEVTAVRISDLKKLNRITKVNYVADKFVHPDSLTADNQIVDLTQPFEFAEKGTLIFVVMNLNPDSPDFIKQSHSLSNFKIGEYWHFTLSLPKIFCASNIYQGSELVARNGEIENYDFIDYTTSYNRSTENYSAKVKRTSIDLLFYTRRQALNLYQTVTVHYQSSGSTYSGIADCPLIGTEHTVTSTVARSQNLLIAFTVLAAVVFGVLIVLSMLKHTKRFIPSIIWIFGIFLILFPKFILGESITLPLLWEALSWSGAFFTLGGTLFALGRNTVKEPFTHIPSALMLVGGILAFVYPFAPFGAAQALRIVFTVIKGLGAAALLALTGLETVRKAERHHILETTTAAVIAIAVIASIFLPYVFPVYCNSMFWLCVVTTVTTFVGVFLVFAETEKANAYLTNNLYLEVERQVKDIKSVIAERDNLLRFVAHDLKKPLQSSSALLDSIIERETDEEQTKGLKIIKQHTAHVIDNLSEVGSYARFNYIAEPSQTTDLSELCAAVFDFHEPDCNANGIILKNHVDKHYKIFVKRQGLENAISNIILNAIEHANCKTVTLSAKTDRNRIILCIADDGKGISDGIEIFRAYSSETDKSSGVGLYICKNIIESMNGELTYENSQNGTTFFISLLKA